MLKKLFPLMIVAVAVLTSCASDDAANGGGGSSAYDGVTAQVSPMEAVAEGGTRSSLEFSATEGMVFKWNDPTPNPDVLTVFPASGAAAGLYTLKTILNEDKNTARFEASGFSLSKDMRYYAFSKKEDKGAHPNWNFPSAGNITVDYTGQRQTASGDTETAHLGEYDFMAATALCSAQDQAYFPFKHLGLTLRMILKGLPEGVEYTELEIYDSENTFRQPIRTIDLTKGLDAEGNYNPAYNALDPTNPSYNNRFKLALGANAEHGITPTDVSGGKGKIVAYIEIPPFDFSGKDIVFSLKSKDGTHDYFGTYAGYKLNAGKAYQMTVNMQPATTYTVNIKVDYDWQLGNTNDTRATGDPGVDDGMEKPEFIYAFFCVDGMVQKYTHFKVGSNDDQSDKSKDAWTDRDNNNIITYKTPLTFSASNPTDATSARVYIAASREELTIPTINENVTPEVTTTEAGITTQGIRDILYDMQSVGTNVELDASQQFMRDLYSTPWSTTNFVGKLSDPYQDVILYHVAAMVDLKWNSGSTITTSTANTVSVNNVACKSLSLFEPTANTAANTTTYTVTSTIEEDRMYNGRQIFFLPQFATYNVTVGTNTQDATFAPATTGGFTSWLRWLKQY